MPTPKDLRGSVAIAGVGLAACGEAPGWTENEIMAAAARELFQWREQIASERNQPLRRILRDDLIVDLALRQPKTAEAVLATRDMNRPGYKKHAADLAACIARGAALPDSQLPKPMPSPDSNS